MSRHIKINEVKCAEASLELEEVFDRLKLSGIERSFVLVSMTCLQIRVDGISIEAARLTINQCLNDVYATELPEGFDLKSKN